MDDMQGKRSLILSTYARLCWKDQSLINLIKYEIRSPVMYCLLMDNRPSPGLEGAHAALVDCRPSHYGVIDTGHLQKPGDGQLSS